MKSGAQTTALDLDNLVATAASWTCACERRFGFISSLLTFLGGLSSSILNDSAPPVEDYTYMLDMAAITSLWATVDEVHEAVLVEAADVLEVPQLRALGEGLDRDDDLTPEPLALARDRLVRDDVELAEGDDHWE